MPTFVLSKATNDIKKMKTITTNQEASQLIKELTGADDVIGTDVSLDVCVNEGYLMMINTKVTPDSYLHFFAFLPDYILAENKAAEHTLMTDTEMSLSYLLEKYNVHKKAIDSFADCNYSLNAKKYKTAYDVLSLADVVNAYCGLD